jgi:hypothetical protein
MGSALTLALPRSSSSNGSTSADSRRFSVRKTPRGR